MAGLITLLSDSWRVALRVLGFTMGPIPLGIEDIVYSHWRILTAPSPMKSIQESVCVEEHLEELL